LGAEFPEFPRSIEWQPRLDPGAGGPSLPVQGGTSSSNTASIRRVGRTAETTRRQNGKAAILSVDDGLESGEASVRDSLRGSEADTTAFEGSR